MAHVKLDCDLPRSSVWRPRDLRSLWVTALLMAKPYVLDEAMPQLHVTALEPTGWMVPPGRYGMIDAAGIGIINQDGLDDEARGYELLNILSSPDPNSRSQEHDGRRLARVNGGWLVLNYARYRDKDWTAAERNKRWRDKAKAEKANASPTVPKAPVGKRARPTFAELADDTVFEEAWALWRGDLKRPGLNKSLAREQWLHRAAAGGEEPQLMLTKTREYAAHVRTNAIEPRHIMLPQTFYGPKRRYDADWSGPMETGAAPGYKGSLLERFDQLVEDDRTNTLT